MAKTFNVAPVKMNGETRFVITDLEGIIIDDMNGYGYKTKTSAYRGYSYKSKRWGK